MFKNIPPSRALLYILFLGLLPLIFSAIEIKRGFAELAVTRNQIEGIQQRAILHERKQAGNMAVINHYRENDHFYIDKQLESLPLMEDEIAALQDVTKTTNYVGNEAIEKRLEQLQTQNQILFTEGPVQSHSLYQETIETLAKPVEVNAQDIERLLKRIERVPTDEIDDQKRPQLTILDFRLDRREATPDHETFLLNLKLLKREYL